MTVDLHVEPPPAVPRPADTVAARLAPMIMALGSVAATGVLLASRSASARGPALILLPLVMLLSAVIAVVSSGGGRWRAELDADRRRYLCYLDSVAARLADDAATLRDRLADRHPEPQLLWAVRPDRLWERGRAAADFGVVRVGLGPVRPETRALAPETPGTREADPVTAGALVRLLRGHESVSDAPVTVLLEAGVTVTVRGPAGQARALVRAVLCQLAATHDPADLTLAVVARNRAVGHWEWIKWLPHRREPAAGERSLHVVVLDGTDGRTVETDTANAVVRIVPGDAELHVRSGADPVTLTLPDGLSAAGALALARRLAGHRPARTRVPCSAGPILESPKTLWDDDSGHVVAIPIGVGDTGRPVELDISEAAAGGIGPHGLCVGATGSGKSELLRTIAAGMIARHRPATLNLILIDFKGGATFLDLARAPHTVAVVTNLGEEEHLVDRMGEALTGEIDRRQRLLRSAGNLTSAADLPDLPALFVIVDEFSEMLDRKPEFADIFVAIGRLGRSLGIHLLLATQRLEEGRLRGLDAHLSYRICLKTLSESESRMAIGVPDAHHLPAEPGSAYLKAGAAAPVRFRAGFVSGPAPAIPGGSAVTAPRLFTADDDLPGPAPCPSGTSVLGAVLDAAVARGRRDPRPHPVWLAPVVESPALAGLLPEIGGGDLLVPIGVVDDVYGHRRNPFVVDLSGAAGNVAIVGGPRSGKTTAARTLIEALSATQLPRRLAVHCLDFGGGLAGLAELPHVGTVARGGDADLVRRTVADVAEVLRRREAGATAGGAVFLVIDGWASARRDYDDLEPVLGRLAGGGLAHGVHLVLTAARWADIRAAMRDQFGTRVEMRLGDPADSEIDRARAARVPRNRPGHGLSPDGLPMVIARPGAAHREEPDGWRVPPVRLLPTVVGHRELLERCVEGGGLVVGLGEDDLRPVRIDLSDQHLLVFGEPGAGKTAVLRLLCREIVRTEPDAALVVLDPRRALPGFGDGGLRALDPLLELLRDRIRDEPTGAAPIHLVVDDYGLAAQALVPLADLLPHARDIGLRVILARNSGGAARALYDPVLAALRESGPMGLQLSAAPEDGPLVGSVRPRAMPPGRGVLVSRGDGERIIQAAWTEPV